MRRTFAFLIISATLAAACSQPDTSGSDSQVSIQVETPADSLALVLTDAMGGLDTWENTRYLRFDFYVDTEAGKRSFRKHLWDRKENRYRQEYTIGTDSMVTVVFNTADTTGQAFINGGVVSEDESRRLVERAHVSYINDTYWLLAPLKVFDAGVSRDLEASDVDGQTNLKLSFQGVGYTPGDQYWLSISDDSGLLQSWTYLLQGRESTRTYTWEDYQTYDTPAGQMTLAPRKTSGSVSIFTDNISFPGEVADMMYESGDTLLD